MDRPAEPIPTLLLALLLALLIGVAGCGGDAEPVDEAGSPDAGVADTDPGDDVELPPLPTPDTSVRDFIVTEMNFYFPEGIAPTGDRVPNPCGLDTGTDNTTYQPLNLDGLKVEGFDLDGMVTVGGDGPCGHRDYESSDGLMGIDYGFLHVIDMVRPARPGQTIQTVLATGPSQGLLKVGMRVTGIDDLENDDDIRIFITNVSETPLLGADGKIIGRSSVAALDEPEFQSQLRGQIVDGVLTAGPGDLSIGHINLLVIEDRVITLKDARIRATFSERPDGVVDVESFVSGWWLNDNILQATRHAVTTIGANPGELECVLERFSDYSSDGESCDGMSMIFRVTAVSGFLTGLDTPEAEGSDE